jgi:hypothetical protein
MARLFSWPAGASLKYTMSGHISPCRDALALACMAAVGQVRNGPEDPGIELVCCPHLMHLEFH